MKRCSTSLIVTEMQINTTMRYHLTPVRMANIKKNPQTLDAGEGVEKRGPSYSGWVHKLVQPLWRTVWRFLKKLKIELPYDPTVPLLGIYPEKTDSKRYMHPNVHNSTITIGRTWKHPTCPLTDEWIKKWPVHTHTHTHTHTMEYHSAIIKNEIMLVAQDRWT